jgi:hypothetical protein
MTGDKTQQEGYKESEHSELKAVPPMMLHTAHIELESGQKHNVVDTYLSEQFERAVSVEDVQSVFSDQHTSQYKADYMGNPKATQ